MALKPEVTPEEYEALPEPIREHYGREGDEGNYELGLDGSPAALKQERAKRREFLNRNVKLREQVEAFEKQVAELEEKIKTASADQATDADARIKRMEKLLEEAEARRLEAETSAKAERLGNAVRAAARAAGVAQAALPLVQMHIESKGFDLTGGGQVETKDGTTIDEGLAALKQELPQVFAGSDGGGTPTNNKKPTSTQPKKVKTILDNLDGINDGSLEWDPS